MHTNEQNIQNVFNQGITYLGKIRNFIMTFFGDVIQDVDRRFSVYKITNAC